MQVAKTGFYFCDMLFDFEFEKLCNFMPELKDSEYVCTVIDEIGKRYIIGFCAYEVDKSKRYTLSKSGFDSFLTSLNYIVSDSLIVGGGGYTDFIKEINRVIRDNYDPDDTFSIRPNFVFVF